MVCRGYSGIQHTYRYTDAGIDPDRGHHREGRVCDSAGTGPAAYAQTDFVNSSYGNNDNVHNFNYDNCGPYNYL